MSLSTALEYVDHERTSMDADEWLDFLIRLRDAIDERIDKHYSPPREGSER